MILLQGFCRLRQKPTLQGTRKPLKLERRFVTFVSGKIRPFLPRLYHS